MQKLAKMAAEPQALKRLHSVRESLCGWRNLPEMQLATVWSAQIPPSPLTHTRDAPRVLSLLGLANSGNGDGCHREPASGKLTLHLAGFGKE